MPLRIQFPKHSIHRGFARSLFVCLLLITSFRSRLIFFGCCHFAMAIVYISSVYAHLKATFHAFHAIEEDWLWVWEIQILFKCIARLLYRRVQFCAQFCHNKRRCQLFCCCCCCRHFVVLLFIFHSVIFRSWKNNNEIYRVPSSSFNVKMWTRKQSE